MIVTQTIYWTAVNWPTVNPATQYAIFVNGAASPSTTTSGGATQAAVSYDDSAAGFVYTIRPTDGIIYGPAQAVVIANQPLNNRAWLRSAVRKAMSDRSDTSNEAELSFTDDEINEYINDAIRNYSLHFPKEGTRTFTLVANNGIDQSSRSYTLPLDFQKATSVEYSFPNNRLQMFLKEEPYKGGETTAGSFFGLPKLGVVVNPMGGRFYPGHYAIYNGVITLDFDPRGDGDTLMMNYDATRLYPVNDWDPLDVPGSDMELLLVYVEAKAWLAYEGKDVRLSRWAGKEDRSRRDDLPTERMSTRLFNAWNQTIRDRKNQVIRHYRLVRR